jgi:hypothetical protein
MICCSFGIGKLVVKGIDKRVSIILVELICINTPCILLGNLVGLCNILDNMREACMRLGFSLGVASLPLNLISILVKDFRHSSSG